MQGLSNTSFNSSTINYPPFDTSSIDPKFKCPECHEIMVNVHQADDCGCRYCHGCLDKIIANKKCTQCDFALVSEFKIPDKYFQKKINNLSVKCVHNCGWTGALNEYREHYNQHFEIENKKCDYCQNEFKSKEAYEKHLNLETGDCLQQPIQCVFHMIGCSNDSNSNSVLTRTNLSSHLETKVSDHLKLVYDTMDVKINNIEAKLKDLSFIKDQGFDQNGLSFNDSSKIKMKQDVLSSNNVDDSRFLLGADSTVSKPKSIQTNLSTPKNTLLETDTKLSQLINKVDMLQNTQNGLINDISKLVKANDKLKQENMSLKDNIKEYKSISQELHKTLALSQVSLLTLEERLINLEKLSCDGSLLWKITNTHERMQEAKSGRQTSFYSPPFYTNRNGYKMCARIYLNGDGNGRNTHLSLFFVILRGENDALLRWPFRQKVTFILIDQSLSESRENVYDAFRPDPNSSSFRRPVSDMNIASGLPVFCPLGKLMSSDHEYIKDNTMFIKIIVDTKDLPEI